MVEQVLETDKRFKAIISACIFVLFVCGMLFAWCYLIGYFGTTVGIGSVLVVILLNIYLYVFQSEAGCLRRKFMDQKLSSLKEAYLALGEHEVKQKRILESIINKIAINRNIHPWVSPSYEPVIKTTIDLSGNKMYTSYRELQCQMRIDVMFKKDHYDEYIVRDLLNTYQS